MTAVPTEGYKDFSIDLAKEAGKMMRANFMLGMKKEWKKDSSPVTATDLAINDLVIKSINKNFPGHGILAEEVSDLPGDHEYIWVCDPVDGTLPFSHGIPISTFSLSLTKNGEAIMGLIYDPFMGRLFFAEKGGGALLNDKPIHVSGSNTLDRGVIDAEGLSNYGIWDVSKRLYSVKAKYLKLYSALYGASLVASGEFIAVIFGGKNAWDAAAAKIIIEEAGGVVTDIFGNDQRYDQPTNGIIASNKHVHAELVKLLSDAKIQ